MTKVDVLARVAAVWWDILNGGRDPWTLDGGRDPWTLDGVEDGEEELASEESGGEISWTLSSEEEYAP